MTLQQKDPPQRYSNFYMRLEQQARALAPFFKREKAFRRALAWGLLLAFVGKFAHLALAFKTLVKVIFCQVIIILNLPSGTNLRDVAKVELHFLRFLQAERRSFRSCLT